MQVVDITTNSRVQTNLWRINKKWSSKR